ncbi:MAG: DUF448 domain-containing protein, partial [Candidatus Cloacimonetes bacterium]|nr:DUF448 domain-containing protein [Candidatus Cloacimonadota bacterium]
RTCVVCKKRFDQSTLLGFFDSGSGVVFDLDSKIQRRKMYVCNTEDCKSKLDAWYTKYSKKERKRRTAKPAVETVAIDYASKILSLMQFARKAGKLIHGTDACLRGIFGTTIRLLVFAADLSDNTEKRIANKTKECTRSVPQIKLLDKSQLSAALGVPESAVFGITDKQFASKILEYWQAGN